MDKCPKEIVYSPNKYRETEGVKDIDIDLTPSRRKQIFDAIRKERGELNLIQVCTFKTEGTRSAIATACRGYRSVDYPKGIEVETAQFLSSLVPQERGFLWSISDVIYGNEEKDRKPNKIFLQEINKYPGLIDIIISIDGLVCGRGQHASGVMLYNESPFETNAIMKSPNGDLITQYELHTSERLGDVKYDFLVTEICDKITICLNLLKDDNLIEKNLGLREIYNKYLHPEILDLEDGKLWDALGNGEVLDVFQFSTGVGLDTAKSVKPRTPNELTSSNAIMRLMGEKGKESPLDRYIRLKNDMNQWYQEVKLRGLSDEEIKILEPYYLPSYGVPALQEDLMMVCMDKNIASFTLKDANAARKTVAKKKLSEIPALKEKFFTQCPNENFALYIWETVIEPQLGYAFSKPHSLAYSFVGIQTLYLATNFPQIYWNCACMIVNAGGADLLNADDATDDEDIEEVSKAKNKSVNYGKISSALGDTIKNGIKVLPPSINDSSLIFKPDIKKNAIIYGLKGINRIGSQLVLDIINNRPYSSIEDFASKNNINKIQLINLIKAGAFDDMYGISRNQIMKNYIDSISDKKKRITLQNMQMLISLNMIPEHLNDQVKLFNFNKYLKHFKTSTHYLLDSNAMKYFLMHYDENKLEDVEITNDEQIGKISISTWDNIYKKDMEPVREWMRENGNQILENLNYKLYQDTFEKYATGSISDWEMDSLGFYYHDHPLKSIKNEFYDIEDFFSLSKEPEIERSFEKDDKKIDLYKIHRIAGTVIDKDKNKSQIVLLTTTGVVTVKIWKNQYALWDRQIFRKNPDGTKTVVERSFFTRGNKIIITGIRRDDNFIPKKYKDTSYPLFEKILETEEGFITSSQTERAEVEE